MSAVLVRRCSMKGGISLEPSTCTGEAVSNFTPGAVIPAWTSSRLLSSRISFMLSSGSMMNESVDVPAV